MKKNRWLSAGLIGMTLLLTACGGSTETSGASAESAAKKNYVYKEEALKWLEAEEFVNANLILKGDKIYVDEYIYPEAEGGAVPEPRALPEAGTFQEAQEAAPEETTAEEEVYEGTVAMAVESVAEVPMPAQDGTVTRKITGYNLAGEKQGEYTFTMPSNSSSERFEIDDKGNLYMITRQYATYEGNDTQDKNFLTAVSPAGEELWKVQIGTEVPEGEYYYVNALVCMGDGSVAVVDNKGVTLYGADGTKGKQTDLGTGDYGAMLYRIRDGKFAFMGDYENNNIQIIDLVTGEKGESVAIPFMRWNYSYYDGRDFDLYLTDGFGIYGYNIGDELPTQLVDFVESDLNISYINSMSVVSETEMLISYYDRVSGKQVVSRIVKIPPEEVKDKEILTLACVYMDDTVRQQLINFNKTSDKYRIRIENYSKYNTTDDYTLGQTRLNTDIVSGKMPDILMVDGTMPVNSYISKGLLADFNEMMEQDPEFNRSDYLENIFDAYSTNGKLYQLVPQFSVTTVVGKTSNVGDASGWTLDEMKQAVEAKGGDTVAFFDTTKSSFLNYYIWMCSEQVVNWETGECFFDGDGFIKVLEYANTLPEKLDESRYNDESFWRNYEVMYREDQVLLEIYGLSSYRDFNSLEQRSFGEDVTLIGFPSEDRNGSSIAGNMTFAMNAKSKNKEAAWDFIKYFLSDEYQDKLEWGFPVKLSSLEAQAKKAQEKPFWLDEKGNKVEYDETYWIDNVEIKITPMTQEKIDKVNKFLKSINQVINYDNQLLNIVIEEAESYFSGQKNVKEVADIIQSRAKIYVNENR